MKESKVMEEEEEEEGESSRRSPALTACLVHIYISSAAAAGGGGSLSALCPGFTSASFQKDSLDVVKSVPDNVLFSDAASSYFFFSSCPQRKSKETKEGAGARQDEGEGILSFSFL